MGRAGDHDGARRAEDPRDAGQVGFPAPYQVVGAVEVRVAVPSTGPETSASAAAKVQPAKRG